jgi:phage-related protein
VAKPVVVKFIGDESKLDESTSNAERRLGDFGQRAKHESEEAAGGFDRLGESSDEAERRSLGLKDTIDGVSTIMQGPGKQGIASYVQGWADLSGGLANFVFPTLKSLTKEVITNTARTVLSTAATARKTVVETIAAAKTKAMAVAQAALNLVMSANPILLVVVAIAALVTGLVIAYKHSETFRNIVQGAFRAVTGAAQATWNWIKSHWPLLLAILTGPIGPAILFIIKHFDQLKQLPGKMLEIGKSIIRGLINGVTSMFGALRDKLSLVTKLIPDWKGPLDKDKKLLRPTGQAIMGGLMGGISDQQPSLKRLLGNITAGIPAAAGAGLSGASGGLSLTINANTNASAADIANEVAWAMRTSGR